MARKLLHVAGSRSLRVRWLLEELELPYELETYALGSKDMKTAEFRTKSPLGKVPALHDGELKLHESGATHVNAFAVENQGK